MKSTKLVLGLFIAIFSLIGCGGSEQKKSSKSEVKVFPFNQVAWWSDVVVPPGYIGYVYKVPRSVPRALAGSQTEFVGVFSGPHRKTYPDVFFYKTILVNKQWATYPEKFNILAFDELNISFSAHVRLRPKTDEASLRSLIEDFGGIEWYPRNVKQPIRTYVRDAVQKYNATEVKANRDAIESEIVSKIQAFFADKPFELDTVSVGNIDYPDVVEKAVEKKLAREQELEENSIKVKIAEKEKTIKLIRAGAEAEAQRLLRETINGDIIMLRYIEALEKLSQSPNKAFFFMPSGAGGNGFPTIQTINPVEMAEMEMETEQALAE